jgi:hypothetical protein
MTRIDTGPGISAISETSLYSGSSKSTGRYLIIKNLNPGAASTLKSIHFLMMTVQRSQFSTKEVNRSAAGQP